MLEATGSPPLDAPPAGPTAPRNATEAAVAPSPRTDERSARRVRVLLPAAYCAFAIAVLLIAVAFAASRYQMTGATVLYWSGQLMLFVAALSIILGRRQSPGALYGAVLAFNLAQYLIKVLYSPLRLKFIDELQHEQTALGMLESARLLPENYSLPISPLYPGLESVTVAVTSVTGMNLFASAVLVAGIAHMLLAAAVLALLELAVTRRDIVALAAIVYCFGSYHAFFNSMFVYQAIALPMAVLLMTQLLTLARQPKKPVRLILAGLLSAGVVVTHHVTALFTGLALLLCTAGILVFPRFRRAAVPVIALTTLHLALLSIWLWIVAYETVAYLREPFDELIENFDAVGSGAVGVGAGQPLLERLFTYGSVAIPLLLLSLLAVVARRRGLTHLSVVAASAAVLQLVLIAVRFAASNGQELAGRAANFTSLYVAFALAAVFTLVAWPPATRRWKLAVTGLLGVLFVGGITSGWPPSYERLPGNYQIAGFESAVDPHAVATSAWVRASLGRGNRFGADFGNVSVIGTLGGQRPVMGGDYSELFYRRWFDPRDADVVQELDLQFLLVDRRMSLDHPPPDSASYFFEDSLAGRHLRPVDLASLQKFRGITGTACVFDDGVQQVYDLRGSLYADSSRY